MLPLVLILSDMPLDIAILTKSKSQGSRKGSPPIMSIALILFSARISKSIRALLKSRSAVRLVSGLKQKEQR